MNNPAAPIFTRLEINDAPLGLEIIVSPQRLWPVLVFLSFWLCAWAAGEVTALKSLFFSKTPILARLFLLVWLTGWTFGGTFALVLWLWFLNGKERITANALRLIVAYEVFGKGWVREYEMAKIRNLRLSDDKAETPPGNNRSRVGKMGRLTFEMDGKTVRFCSTANPADALQVLEALKNRYASLGGPRKF